MVIFAALKNYILPAINDDVKDLYGGQIRVRACGICVAEGKILLVNHAMYGTDGFFWSPPGGGIIFGETAQEAVQREFKEETGLEVEVGSLLFFNEHIADPLHAIELFFEITSFEGAIIKGLDPEFLFQNQIIQDVRFMNWQEISRYHADQLHRLFSKADSVEGILRLNNYIN
ncbi:MAG: NUDIX hydrolase [Dyadobacter sp.]|uniref:NUDIX hydrolase n=1 Tax=Dyadobacter sp. TaxID=1914288 RepID=UPI0032661AFC